MMEQCGRREELEIPVLCDSRYWYVSVKDWDIAGTNLPLNSEGYLRCKGSAAIQAVTATGTFKLL